LGFGGASADVLSHLFFKHWFESNRSVFFKMHSHSLLKVVTNASGLVLKVASSSINFKVALFLVKFGFCRDVKVSDGLYSVGCLALASKTNFSTTKTFSTFALCFNNSFGLLNKRKATTTSLLTSVVLCRENAFKFLVCLR